MSNTLNDRIANAQRTLELMNMLGELGESLANRLADADTRASFIRENQRAAAQELIDAQLSAAEDAEGQPESSKTSRREGLEAKLGEWSQQVAGVSSAVPVEALASAATQMAEVWADYGKTVEVETTRRAHIEAWRDITTKQIAATRQTLEMYLEKTFDERRTNFERMFDALDQAQENGDLQGMQLMLSGILDLAKSTPFKDLAAFKQQIADPNFVLEL